MLFQGKIDRAMEYVHEQSDDALREQENPAYAENAGAAGNPKQVKNPVGKEPLDELSALDYGYRSEPEELKPEKKDVLAMILAGFIVILPAALLVLLILVAVGYFFFFH